MPNRASGYAPTERGSYEISMTTLPMIGDGGVFTSVEDLSRWDANFYEPRVGGGAFLDQMLERGVLNDGETLDYAFGLGHGSYRGLKTVSHAGGFVGFRAQMLRFPNQSTTIICLCNRADANPTRLAREVADVVLADRLGPREVKSTDAESGSESEDVATVEISDELLRELAGTYYSNELLVDYDLRVNAGALELTIGAGGDARPLEPSSPDEFRLGGRTFRFERDASGRVSGFRLDAGRVKNLRFERRSPEP